MGVLGYIYHGGAAALGMTGIADVDIDKHLERGKKSLFMSLIDPIGILDIGDIVEDVTDG